VSQITDSADKTLSDAMMKTRWNILGCTIVIALAAIAIWPAFHSPGQPMDEGAVLVYPEMLLKGLLPYRDFETNYGPGNILILAAAYAGFGTNIFVERAIGLIYRLLILLALFGILRRWGTLIASGCTFIAAILIVNTDLWANTWVGAVAFGLCALWAILNANSRWRSLLAGLLAGVTLLYRVDFGLALIAGTLPLFLSIKSDAKWKFLAGMTLGLLPLMWLAVAIGPAQLAYRLFWHPVFELRLWGYLPISTADPGVLCLFYLQVMACALNLAAAFLALRESKSNLGRVFLGVTLFGLGLTYYALSRFDSGHVLNAALVSVSILPLSIFIFVSALARKSPRWIMSIVAILLVIAATHLLAPTFTRHFYRGFSVALGFTPARPSASTAEVQPGDAAIFVNHNGRSFPFGFSYAAEDADKVLNELQRVSLPGQRLFVGPGDLRRAAYCDTYIYHMLPQLRPATYFLEMNPGSVNAPHSRLADDMATADWLVLNRRWDFINEPNQSSQFGSDEANQVILNGFDLWWKSGSYLLFRNKKLGNSIVPLPQS
jgi:hypothetical protein